MAYGWQQRKKVLHKEVVQEMTRPPLCSNEKGFTLLELVVTVTLVAMVVLLLSMALKLTIGAWEKGQEQGSSFDVMTSLPRLLERQLECVMMTTSVPPKARRGLYSICGDTHSLTFFSSFAPMGSPLQGVLRVTYLYDEEKKSLVLYEQVVTKADDLNEETSPLSEYGPKDLRPISEVDGLERFELAYSGKNRIDEQDEDQWEEEWKCNSSVPPKLIRLTLGLGDKEASRSFVWYFRVGRH